MKNQSTNKMPQATCSGDVMGGSTVRGKAWGFLFLRRALWQDNLDKKGDAIHRLERVEAIGKFLNWVSKDKIYTNIPFDSFVQNCGELIEDDLRHIKEFYVG